MIRKRDQLPPLRDVIAAYDLGALKRFGQHFLLDLNLTEKIAKQAGPLKGVTVWEVGPGPGGLTRALLDYGASKVIAVERDPRFLPAMEQLKHVFPGQLELLNEDALETNERGLVGDARCMVIANLPYNISTTLLLKWLSVDPWPPWFESLTLMFQKEVAARLSAEPSTKDYGRLTIAAQWRCEVYRLFDVPARAFTPPPKVDSSVVQLIPRADNADTNLAKAIEQVARAAFGQRRKMLRSSLRSLFPLTEDALESCGIAPTDRAENLSVEDYERLGMELLANR